MTDEERRGVAARLVAACKEFNASMDAIDDAGLHLSWWYKNRKNENGRIGTGPMDRVHVRVYIAAASTFEPDPVFEESTGSSDE